MLGTQPPHQGLGALWENLKAGSAGFSESVLLGIAGRLLFIYRIESGEVSEWWLCSLSALESVLRGYVDLGGRVL